MNESPKRREEDLDPIEKTAWIFVSHASADLTRVREVRNHLESRGGAPLLFHLRALTKPQEFWPVIQQEIGARNFFLYCESPHAERSEWVRRERHAVEEVRKHRSIRIGSIRVDREDLQFDVLNRFLADTRVFATYSRKDRNRVEPFIRSIRSAGFQTFDLDTAATMGGDFGQRVRKEIDHAAENGWIVAFISGNALASEYVRAELLYAFQLSARILPVLLEPVALPTPFNLLPCLDATMDENGAMDRLVSELLSRR